MYDLATKAPRHQEARRKVFVNLRDFVPSWPNPNADSVRKNLPELGMSVIQLRVLTEVGAKNICSPVTKNSIWYVYYVLRARKARGPGVGGEV
jgi:hypothetical protein